MRTSLITILTSFISFAASAQEKAEKNFWTNPISERDFQLYIIIGFVFLVFFVCLAVAIVLRKALNVMNEQIDRDRAKAAGQVYVRKPSFWFRLSEKFNDAVPIEKEQDIDLGHSYDGIRELDNHLPPWWKWLFYATIGWSVVYLMIFHVFSSMPLSVAEYDLEVAAAEQNKQKLMASRPQDIIDPDKLEFSNDPERIAKGKMVFTNINCGSCHRADGGGNSIGPNLTDEYWLHGGDMKSVFQTINKGIVEKGMPAWGKALSPSEVRDVSYFILSLQGTNPANPKAPQGDLFEAPFQKNDSLSASASRQ